VHSL
jgi:WD40 repeat protein